MRKKSAFTLVELIVVIAVLAVLASIAFSTIKNITQDARNSTRLTDMSTIAGAINTLAAQGGRINTTGLAAVEVAGTNKDTSFWVGYLTGNTLPSLPTPPKDPDTNLPYAFSAYTGGSGSSQLAYAQVGTVLNKATPNASLAVRGNIDYVADRMLNILPKKAVTDMPAFLASPFGQGTARIYGMPSSAPNRFMFATSGAPAADPIGATANSIFMEDYTNLPSETINNDGYTVLRSINEPAGYAGGIDVFSHNNSNNESYYKMLKAGSPILNYEYVRIDSSKKYLISMDIKGHLATAGQMVGICGYSDNWAGIWANQVAVLYIPITINTTYTTYSLSINGASGTNNINTTNNGRPIMCSFFFQVGTAAAGDEIYFDNLKYEQVP